MPKPQTTYTEDFICQLDPFIDEILRSKDKQLLEKDLQLLEQ